MKFKLIIDPEKEEQVTVVAHKKTRLTDAIEQMVYEQSVELIGYKDRQGVKLDLADICCFVSEGDRVFAICENEKLQLRLRLYQLEQMLPNGFIKINQSCLANREHISKFNASVSGTLKISFKNGYTDYVSRRQLKTVKERLGL